MTLFLFLSHAMSKHLILSVLTSGPTYLLAYRRISAGLFIAFISTIIITLISHYPMNQD